MATARANPEGGRTAQAKSEGMELGTPTKSGLYTKSYKSGADAGHTEAAMRRTPSVAGSSSTVRRGSISMLARQLRMLEAQKEGGASVRFVDQSCCRAPYLMYAELPHVGKLALLCARMKSSRTALQ